MNTDTLPKPNVGDTLPNGATVVAVTNTHLLAHWNNNEYATWRWGIYRGSVVTEHGNYFQYGPTWGATMAEALHAAANDLLRR